MDTGIITGNGRAHPWVDGQVGNQPHQLKEYKEETINERDYQRREESTMDVVAGVLWEPGHVITPLGQDVMLSWEPGHVILQTK